MPYSIVRKFEAEVAKYAGAKYAVAVESCSAAIFLCCEMLRVGTVRIPKFTYPGVPCAIIHAGGRVHFTDGIWEGVYELEPYGIIDGALRFTRGMYQGGLHCLSFHMKKHLPIGRGGMILTDDKDASEYLRKARFDGRDECPLQEDNFTMLGWNMYMTPEQAIRGLELMAIIPNHNEDLHVSAQRYPDLSKYKVYGG